MKGNITNQNQEGGNDGDNDTLPYDRYGNYVGEMTILFDSIPGEKIPLKDIANTIDPNTALAIG